MMWIDSTGNIKDINCGFVYRDGSFYGTDEYKRGCYTHEKILQHFNIKEEPGVIRFCLSFIMLESSNHLNRRHKIKISDEYNIECITQEQSKLIREWMSKLQGNIFCPHTASKQYQIRYLETLDDRMFTNIITL